MGLSGHFHTLPNLFVNKEPWDIQHEAGCSPEPVIMSTEQNDLIVVFLQDILHTSHLPSTKYRKWGVEGRGTLC